MTMPPTANIPTTPVFITGEAGISNYRIPAIVRMANGELLALAEARVANSLDHGGPIRLVAKIGDETGTNWSDPITVSTNILPDGEEQVVQNPAPVVDMTDPDHPGKILVMFNKAERGEHEVASGKSVRRFFTIESIDHGRTWQNERDITHEVHKPLAPAYTRIHADAADRYNHPEDWRMSWTPVGHAIQLHGGEDGTGPNKGRLLFSNFVTRGESTVFQGQAHLVYSDDHGASWQHSELSPVLGVNEMMAVEQANGDVLVNFRNYATPDHLATAGRGQLVFRTLPDGTYEAPVTHTAFPDLPMPGNGLQGSIHRVADTPTGPMLLTGCDNRQTREGLTVWRSDDEGASWQHLLSLDPGPSAYSDLVTLTDGSIGLLYERGGDDDIVFGTFQI